MYQEEQPKYIKCYGLLYCLETDHSVLWVRLFMGHLQQLLRCAHTHLTEHVKPATAQETKQCIRIRSDTDKKVC